MYDGQSGALQALWLADLPSSEKETILGESNSSGWDREERDRDIVGLL